MIDAHVDTEYRVALTHGYATYAGIPTITFPVAHMDLLHKIYTSCSVDSLTEI